MDDKANNFENDINELKEILEYYKGIPTDIDSDLLEKVLAGVKDTLENAKKEIQVPKYIEKEYKKFKNHLNKKIENRKKVERKKAKELRKDMKKSDKELKKIAEDIEKSIKK